MRTCAALVALLLARHAAARSAPAEQALLLPDALMGVDALTPSLERALPPFTALDLGGTGCWPLSVHVAPGPHALLLEGGADESVGDAIVSSVEDGVLSLHVAEGGLVSAKALHVTVRVPDGQLGALTLRAAARDVLLSAAPAPELRVAPGGAGRVVLRPAAAAASAAPGSAGSLILTVTQGTQPVTVCSPVPQTLSLVAVTNNAVADVRVENYTAPKATLRSTGKGALYVFPGAPFAAAEVLHSGSGEVQVAAASVTLQQSGSGDLYITAAAHLAGRLSGSGDVLHDGGDSTVLVTGKGRVELADAPPPPPQLDCGAALPEPAAGQPRPAWLGFRGAVDAATCAAVAL